MKTLLTTAALCLLPLSGTALAQDWTESFDGGSNGAGWEIWWNAFNTLPTAGGNPGGYLELNNTAGSSNCQFVELFPDASLLPHPFSGDWRQRGVATVGVDAQIKSGPTPSADTLWSLILVSDPGTPGDESDDCRLVYQDALSPIPTAGAGWLSVDWPVDSLSVTIPPGWIVEGPCSGFSWDMAWNNAIVDVDWFEIRMDMDSTVFCAFSTWEMGFDNPRVLVGDGIGANYCTPATPNSTGLPGEINALGSPVVINQTLSLEATSLPPNQFCLFLASQTQGLVMNPGGSQGDLCVVGTIARFDAQLGSSGASGSYGIPVDMMNIPTTPAAAITAGQTWNFQMWHRDLNPMPTSNFTDAISILFL